MQSLSLCLLLEANSQFSWTILRSKYNYGFLLTWQEYTYHFKVSMYPMQYVLPNRILKLSFKSFLPNVATCYQRKSAPPTFSHWQSQILGILGAIGGDSHGVYYIESKRQQSGSWRELKSISQPSKSEKEHKNHRPLMFLLHRGWAYGCHRCPNMQVLNAQPSLKY